MDVNGSLFSQVALLSEYDDGIKLNSKLLHLKMVLNVTCQTLAELWTSFIEMNERCLEDRSLCVKVAIFISSSTFATYEMFGLRLRNILFNRLLNAAHWLRNDKKRFFNSLKLIGDIYRRARLLDGNPIQLLAKPIINYLEMSLKEPSLRGSEELTAQLYLNGPSLQAAEPDLVRELMQSTRNVIIKSRCKATMHWLMLCVDISYTNFTTINQEFEVLYEDMQKYDDTETERKRRRFE